MDKVIKIFSLSVIVFLFSHVDWVFSSNDITITNQDLGYIFLESGQNVDGSWGVTLPVQDTAVSIKALAQLQPDSPAIGPAYAWILNHPATTSADAAHALAALSTSPFDTINQVDALLSLQYGLFEQTSPQLNANDPIPVDYQDDFSDPNSGFSVYSDSFVDMGYDAGEYHIIIESANFFYFTMAGPQFTDFDAEIDTRYEGSSTDLEYGLIFRGQAGDNYYAFGLSSNSGTYILSKVIANNWQPIIDWTASSAILSGSNTNKLGVIAEGDQIDLYINDTLVDSITDNTISDGLFGLYSRSEGTDGTAVYFDNLSATGTYQEPEPPEPVSGWGQTEKYFPDNWHTALALYSLSEADVDPTSLTNAIARLMSSQNSDGSWGLQAEQPADLTITAYAVLALSGFGGGIDSQTALDAGSQYLLDQQNGDGGWGDSGSTVHESALSYYTLSQLGLSPNNSELARTFLEDAQLVNGSWNDSPYDTAWALLALNASPCGLFTPTTLDSISVQNEQDLVLTWTAVSNANSYTIYRGVNDPYFEPTIAYATTSNNSFTDIGVSGDINNSYYYVVRANNGCGESVDSNRLGQFNLTVEPDWNLLTLPLQPSDGSLDAVLGTQLFGTADPLTADRILIWDSNTQTYESAWFCGGSVCETFGEPFYNHWLANDFSLSTLTLEPDTGFWLQNRSGSTENLSYLGEIILTNRTVEIGSGFQLIGTPHHDNRTLDEANIPATGTEDPLTADRILYWDAASQTYESAWFCGGPICETFGEPFYNHWLANDFSLSPVTLLPGQGFWYQNRNISFDWINVAP